jgi:hypothetical protein
MDYGREIVKYLNEIWEVCKRRKRYFLDHGTSSRKSRRL